MRQLIETTNDRINHINLFVHVLWKYYACFTRWRGWGRGT